MDRLAGSSAGLDSVMDPLLVRGVEDRLSNARDDRERIDIVQGFLKSRLPSLPLDPLVGETIRRIRHSRGNVAISELVRGLATNPDTLEKRFRRVVGATPKMFSRIVRFQSFVDGYSARTSLTEAALLAGFYDHAHLVKEFRTFTGQSPTEYFLRPRQW
jgi:methylphosphotriester-DNA--protein-cysteine methyltransferase